MARLIDAEALKESKFISHDIDEMSHEEFEQLVDYQPTVDAAPVVYGKWVHVGARHFECSICHKSLCSDVSDFCPDCGADMRGDQE